MTMVDVEQALKAAKDRQLEIEREFAAMVRMLRGQLRHAHRQDDGTWSSTTAALKAMKRELQNFDSRTGRWKD